MWYIVRRGEFVEVHVGVSVETVRVGQSGVVGFSVRYGVTSSVSWVGWRWWWVRFG